MRGLIRRIRGTLHLRQLVGCEHACVVRRPAGRCGGGAPLGDRLRSVHHVDEIERALRAILRVVADADGVVGDARRAAPRGDEDDAVRAAAAVHRRRRGVLQDLDGLDRRRVEILDAARQRHAVHDVERSVPRRDRPDAAHGHVHRNAGAVAAARHHIHARDPRLDRLHGVRGRDFRNLFRGHRTDGAGQVAALLRAVADDDEAFELDRRRDEPEVQCGARGGVHRHTLRHGRVAHEPRAHLSRPRGHVADHVPTGRVGGGCAVRAQYDDGRAGDGARVGGVGHRTRDPALRVQANRGTEGGQNEQAVSHENLPDHAELREGGTAMLRGGAGVHVSRTC